MPNQAQAARLAARRRPPAAARLLRGVYLATPLFALADLVFGINVRTPFFDATPALKWVYYPAAFAAGSRSADGPGSLPTSGSPKADSTSP